MSHVCEPNTSISIARHTVQFILRHALDAKTSSCLGLIGRKPLPHNDSAICYAVPITTSGASNFASTPIENSDIQHTMQLWHQEEVQVCGSYFTTESGLAPDSAQFDQLLIFLDQTLQTVLANHYSKPPISPLIHLPLLLGTAGCLEAFAYQITGEKPCPVPLLLAEDGQQAKNG